MSLISRTFFRWLTVAVGCTLVMGVSYVFVQQSYRMGANDPQTMLAHDTATAIAAGVSPDRLVASQTVDPSFSLAPFVIVFDAKLQPVASSARLAGSIPRPPAGVLEAAATGENAVTWQPRADTRIAAVIAPVEGGGGYVLAGRSLRAVEERISSLTLMAGLGWLVTMVATFVFALFGEWMSSRTKPTGA